MEIKVKVKKLHENAVIPRYAKPGDAGMDLTICWREYEQEPGKLKVGFGIAIEIPDGHVGLVFPRSSIYKTNLTLSNCVGVIDSGYRGEITAVFNTNNLEIKSEPILRNINGFECVTGRREYFERPSYDRFYQVGDRAAQIIIMPYPQVEFEEVEELSSSERGEGGFGSSGK